MERRIGNTVLRLVRGDIADMEVDAFVFDITEVWTCFPDGGLRLTTAAGRRG